MSPRNEDIYKLWDDPSKTDAPSSTSHASISRIRSGILEESIDTNRQRQSKPRKRFTWTKRPKYDGFQSTLNSNDNMKPLAHARSSPAGTHEWSSSTSPASLNDDGGLKFVESCKFSPMATAQHGVPDPIMVELENMQQNQEKRPDPQLKEVESRSQSHHEPTAVDVLDCDFKRDRGYLPQPDIRPLSHDVLVAEVKAMYAGLVWAEAKCIEIDKNYQTKLKTSNDEWRNLIALHRTLLHEHHDFFVASQQPSASPALKSLASKYSMPTRMWEHGIHAFLEMLRQRGPDTLEHMRNFVSSTSTVIGELMESVPCMMDQWTKISKGLEEYDSVLGDLECHTKRELSGSSSWLNRSTPVASFSARSESWCPPRHVPAAAAMWEQPVRDWDLHRHPSVEPLEPESTYWKSIMMDASHLPDYVFDTLIGWLYYGQGIAWNDFNIYSKVFAVLSSAAQKIQYVSGPFFTF